MREEGGEEGGSGTHGAVDVHGGGGTERLYERHKLSEVGIGGSGGDWGKVSEVMQ